MFIKKISNPRAFTIVEVLMASVITLVVGIAIAVLFVTSMRMFSRGMAQADVQRRAGTALDRISRDIRNSSQVGGVAIFNSYAGAVPNITQGNYIQITSATIGVDAIGNPIPPITGYYLSTTNGINFIRDVTADNPAIESDDKEIISGVNQIGPANIFTRQPALPPLTENDSMLIQFGVTSSRANVGSQSANFITDVYMRNP